MLKQARLDTSYVSCRVETWRDVTSQVEFGLISHNKVWSVIIQTPFPVCAAESSIGVRRDNCLEIVTGYFRPLVGNVIYSLQNLDLIVDNTG